MAALLKSLPQTVLPRSGLRLDGQSYRGRIAPSPTGYLHLGHARTFWIAYQQAMAGAGTLILRNEDLDPDRARPQFAQAMLEDLEWLGIRWQEGPDVGGAFGPYTQSQRRSLYLEAWRKLLRTGCIYPCHCSRKDLAQVAHAPHDDEPIYPGTCRPGTCRPEPSQQRAPEPAQAPVTPAGINWRFRVPDGEAIKFVDGRLGPQRFVAGEDFGDFLLWRRDDVPAYQLAVVVDDGAMRVTEVVRGADLLRSTARQILLMRALEIDPPAWRHCELLLDEQGRRLAKRHDAWSLRVLRQQGRQPEDILRLAGVMP